MKKLSISLMVIGLLFSRTFAYTPTSQDVSAITALKTQFDAISSGDVQAKGDFYIQLKNLKEQFSGYEKLGYYLDTIASYMMAQVNTEKTKTKTVSKQLKQSFLDQYSGYISTGINAADTCTGRYNTIDSISYANNFPTALTMATRYRETSCGYYLPSNGDGPFQILNKDYGTGEITEGKFLTAIQDYVKFSQNKYGQYYSKIGPIFTYTGFDMTGITNYAALYNGGVISGGIVLPNNPKYVYDGYGTNFSGATKYGIVAKFLKILDRELKNTY